MPIYQPIPPELHPQIRRATARLFTVAGACYALAWAATILRLSPWIIIPIAAPVLIGVLIAFSLFRKRCLAMSRHQHAALPFPLNLRFSVAGALVGVSVFVLWHASMYSISPSLSGMATGMLLAAPLWAVGFGMTTVGFFAREPAPPSCPKCAYPVADLAFPLMCPECAQPLPTPAAATTTPRVRRPGLGWCGVACLGSAIAVFGLTAFRPAAIVTNLPRPVRMAIAGSDPNAFKSINTAALSEAERKTLIDRVLDARTNTPSYRLQSQLAWLGTELLAGSLSPDQARRLTRDGWSLSITADSTPRAGRRTIISLAGTAPEQDPSTLSSYYFTRGFAIGPDQADQPLLIDTPQPYYLADYLGWPWDIRKRRPEITAQPTASITPDAPGRITVRARVVAAVFPAGTPAAITWNADGTYAITPPPLDTHELTAETTLEVTP